MLNINNASWSSLDKETVETFINGIQFIKPKDDITIPLECPSCKKLVSSAEEVESIKETEVCDQCYLIHYYSNKDKWDNEGWRPYNKN